jgi:hypothetical protein
MGADIIAVVIVIIIAIAIIIGRKYINSTHINYRVHPS